MKMERKAYIDYLRVFACIIVILIHIFSTARTDFSNHTMIEEIVTKSIVSICHFAVPIFFMITGYLFLTKDDEHSLKTFFKKYVLKYILAIFIFGYSYAVIEEIFNNNYNISILFKALLNTFQGNTWAHMWYLYSLVGVMLFIPIIKILLEKSEKYLRYFLAILLISSLLLPLINNFFNIKSGFDLIIHSVYLSYAIIGYYLGNSKRKSNLLGLFGIIILLFIIVLTQYLAITYENLGKLSILSNYDSPIILLLAILIFNLFKNIKSGNGIISYISPYTYSIYLIHMFWINFIYKFLKINIYDYNLAIVSLLLFIIVFVLSLLSSIVLKKLPFLKKIL